MSMYLKTQNYKIHLFKIVVLRQLTTQFSAANIYYSLLSADLKKIREKELASYYVF